MFGFVSVGGIIAVQGFYIISGFYMALILNEKYTGEGYYRLFITNRFLRLFPLYWTVLVLTAIVSFIMFKLYGEGLMLGMYMRYFSAMDAKSVLYLAFTNLFMFGQDTIWFLKFNYADGSLAFTADYTRVVQPFVQVHKFLFVPQGWTLGVELLFYLLAPFLVRKRLSGLAALIAASLLLRVYLYSAGFDYIPWVNGFFPTELAFFLFGIVSYRIYRRFNTNGAGKVLYPYIFSFAIVYTLIYQFLPGLEIEGQVVKQWVYYLILTLAIPFVFILTKGTKIDNYVGEYSYPIYISHFLFLYALKVLVVKYDLPLDRYGHLIYAIAIALPVLFSAVMVHTLVHGIEKYRQKRVKSV